MPLPKKIKPFLPLTEPKTLLPRRYELLEKINKEGTYLPKSILHADLDRGFLDFVKDELKTVVNGKVIPTVDIIVTTQNWSQFVETWDFQNLDKNVEPPLITTVRNQDVKLGNSPSIIYNIPNRRLYFYAQVPTWDGQRNGYDVYKIPQPVPVDITFTVKIICNRMRELNAFNKVVLEKFSSRQAYQVIKGHYIPIVMNNISNESELSIEKRNYYIQTYEFTMLGFLIDEDEFEVSPAINRVLQVVELDEKVSRKQKKNNSNPSSTTLDVLFLVGNSVISQLFDYTVNLNLGDTFNVEHFQVYINNLYYGEDISQIQVNTGDVVRITITKNDDSLESKIQFNNLLI
jgi:hypothetical protein